MTRTVLGFVMVAVAFAAGGLNGYSAGVSAFAHAAHDHADHGPGAAHVHHYDHASLSDVADACATEDCGETDTADHTCAHMHVHCCASFTAVPAGDCVLKLAMSPDAHARAAVAPMALGQAFYPLLRPPSATV